MKLVTRCKSCNKDIIIKSNAATRPDLQMQKGDEFQVNCLNCGNRETKHVNDIKAEANNVIILIGVAIGVIASAVLWVLYGALGTLGLAIPVLFWYQQMDATKGFNSYMIKRI